MTHVHRDEPLMVPGMGAQPVPVKEWVAANDNEPNDKLRRLMRGHLTAEESAELDEAFACPPAGFIADMTSAQIQAVADGNGEPPVCQGTAYANGQCIGLTPIHRYGQFMQTFTGRKFWPMDPRAEDVDIRDIAHSLSMQCRYAGHCISFYSVAEHSVLMSRHLRRHGYKVALTALLHDASEAYLIDVPRPVKPFLEGYQRAEKAVQREIFAKFGLPLEIPSQVHEADERIIADELVNLKPMDWHATHDNPLGVTIRNWSPADAEREFLATYAALVADLAWEAA